MRDKRVNYGVCKANFVLAQKETKNVSDMSPKSGQSVLKIKETKGVRFYRGGSLGRTTPMRSEPNNIRH